MGPPALKILFSPPSFKGGESNLPFGFAKIWFAFGIPHLGGIILRLRVPELCVMPLMETLVRHCLALLFLPAHLGFTKTASKDLSSFPQG